MVCNCFSFFWKLNIAFREGLLVWIFSVLFMKIFMLPFLKVISPVVRIIYLFLFLTLNNSQSQTRLKSLSIWTHTQLSSLIAWTVYVKKPIVFISLVYVSLPPAAFQNFPCSAFLPFENRRPKYRAFCLFLLLICLIFSELTESVVWCLSLI